MPEPLQTIVDDLAAEQGVLLDLLQALSRDKWDLPSPAEGWSLRDCVAHLAETDESALAGVEERSTVFGERPFSPSPRRERGPGGEVAPVLTAGQLRSHAMTPAEMVTWYRSTGEALVSALRKVSDDDRITWAGRPMSARSYVTARLMEHWSHGLDIHDTAGVTTIDTGRLRHIALLGHITRDFAYRTHGLTPPRTPLYVELTSPSAATWTYGPPDATDRSYGPAGDTSS